ncbi:MAG TPA: SDR family oxidoreductase [Polyangia bacterium]|nr:SDR family oxidoreductase [Polyangia bacterium]
METKGARLSNKTCLVTGASRGLGRAVARRFWSEGASLVLPARQPDSVASLVAELPARAEQRLVALSLDLNDPESVRSLVPRTKAQGVETLAVLVNNAAALGPIGRAWENDGAEWAAAVTADLVSPALICGAVVPWMAHRPGGRIINLSGGGATGPRPRFTAYAAAKAGLVRFSEILAEEVKELGITVNCVSPGVMATDMLAAVQRAGAGAAGEKEVATAQKGLGGGDKTMQAAVDLITFLASDASAGVTGKLISAVWDNWEEFPERAAELSASDVFTLRRIAGRDRGLAWCDK